MHGSLPNQVLLEDPETRYWLDAYAARLAEDSFWQYRLLMNPNMLIGWWQQQVAAELQQFADDLEAGLAPKLLLQAPRQHGKSIQVIDLLGFIAGRLPDANTIFTSYSERLGIRANLRLQRAFDDPKYREVFPNTKLSGGGKDATFLRNHNVLEFIDRQGSFRNTTVGGRVVGESLDLGVIDDPIKGREEANSQIIRDKTWEWFTDDFLGCFSKNAGLLVIATRYHVDDPVGRMIENLPGLKVIRYPAIAEKNEPRRRKGEALFPELKPLKWLQERQRTLSNASFEAIYQQSPIIVGGGLFPIEKFEIVGGRGTKAAPGDKDIKRSVRYWDKAGTAGGGAYTAGVLLHALHDGRFFVSDVRRGQWSALEREERIRQTAIIDKAKCKSYTIWLEQEPGSGGKESAEYSVRKLAGFSAYADKVGLDKEVRADPYAAQVQNGNVLLLSADWNRPFLDEHEQFPSGKYKDQVDAAAGAFLKITAGGQYDASLKWVG